MADISSMLDTLPDISFIENLTLENIQTQFINDFQAKYKELTGSEVILGLADPNRIILYACALQHYQALQYIDKAGKMGLLKYSYGDFLEMLGSFKKVTRNQATAAITIIKFQLASTRESEIIIPKGTQITNGVLYFETDEYVEIPAGVISIEVSATCTIKGTIGNDILPGEIKTLSNPIAYIENVENITITSGGSEIESDESYSERIYLSPASYSVAGPDDAYEYWIKTFNSDITDVKVTSPKPGVVDIRFILNDGDIPEQSVIDDITEKIKDKEIRPLTDYVQIAAPKKEEYSIDLKYYINTSQKNMAVTIQSEVNKAIDKYNKWQQSKMGRDINPDKLVSYIEQAGAKRAVITAPVFKTIGETSIANLINVNIVYGGLEDD